MTTKRETDRTLSNINIMGQGREEPVKTEKKKKKKTRNKNRDEGGERIQDLNTILMVYWGLL